MSSESLLLCESTQISNGFRVRDEKLSKMLKGNEEASGRVLRSTWKKEPHDVLDVHNLPKAVVYSLHKF